MDSIPGELSTGEPLAFAPTFYANCYCSGQEAYSVVFNKCYDVTVQCYGERCVQAFYQVSFEMRKCYSREMITLKSSGLKRKEHTEDKLNFFMIYIYLIFV